MTAKSKKEFLKKHEATMCNVRFMDLSDPVVCTMGEAREIAKSKGVEAITRSISGEYLGRCKKDGGHYF
jgi:hypothetical protein